VSSSSSSSSASSRTRSFPGWEADDDVLVDAVLEGDDRAFRVLVDRYEPVVASTVIGMMGPGPQADDVGQEVMIRLYESLERFRGEASLKTYVTRIAINASIDALRKRKRRVRRLFSRDDEAQLNEPVVDESETVDERERRALVRRAIRQLDEHYRSVVVLRMLDGYSTKETADILDIPDGTVLSRLHRAKQQLGELLRPYLGRDDP
jgi:RNA polymerase sigma-70 factor (ECF subfamily)